MITCKDCLHMYRSLDDIELDKVSYPNKFGTCGFKFPPFIKMRTEKNPVQQVNIANDVCSLIDRRQKNY